MPLLEKDTARLGAPCSGSKPCAQPEMLGAPQVHLHRHGGAHRGLRRGALHRSLAGVGVEAVWLIHYATRPRGHILLSEKPLSDQRTYQWGAFRGSGRGCAEVLAAAQRAPHAEHPGRAE